MNQRILDYLSDLYDRLELSHSKCDLSQSVDCDAEQYGDGNADEHTYIQLLKQDAKLFEQEMEK